ncbi:hypothetical protein MATL_G00159520 [Megalops atlanticus]|uniref:Ig-like domain-containing protein n=1 Tax=Megalops atlanticus TaxID=7932 RepID=A0A9D3PQA1_MEGAT|nr:hypothetical protein MATL_G00159520 [Megalops atlanticus]
MPLSIFAPKQQKQATATENKQREKLVKHLQGSHTGMSWTLRITVVFFVVSLVLNSLCFAGFDVTVPSTPQFVIHGRYAVLDCRFPVGATFDLASSVITWQRGLEVVHSFYRSRDQLDRQSRRYANRTSLYYSELRRGNASLRLDHVTPDDAGAYTCSVSTLSGSQKKTFPVKFAALYTEPHLLMTASSHGMELQLTSRGYPAATVQWLNERGEDVTNSTVTHSQKDIHGLYIVSSTLTQDRGANSTLTFVLRNEDLKQEMRREFSLQSEAEEVPYSDHRCRLVVLLPLGLVITVIGLGVLAFCFRKSCFKTPIKRSQNGHVPALNNRLL